MRVAIRLFAAMREQAGVDALPLELRDSASVADMRSALVEQCPALTPWREHCRVAVNQEFVNDDRELKEDDEIALIPPVSGG